LSEENRGDRLWGSLVQGKKSSKLIRKTKGGNNKREVKKSGGTGKKYRGSLEKNLLRKKVLSGGSG